MRRILLLLLVASPLLYGGMQQGAPNEKQNIPNQSRPTVSAAVINSNSANTNGQYTQAQFDPWYVWFPNWGLLAIGAVTAYLAIRTLGEISRQTFDVKKSADAAYASAEAVINTERAWVMTELAIGTGGTIQRTEDGLICQVCLICTNKGKTPAWIEEQRGAMIVTERPPASPDLSTAQYFYNHVYRHPLSAGDAPLTNDGSFSCRGLPDETHIAVIYGIVKYRDIFDRVRQTTFGYRVTPDLMRLERLASYPEYNKSI